MNITSPQIDRNTIVTSLNASKDEESSAIKETKEKVDTLEESVWWPKFWLYSALILGGISAVLIAIFTLRSESRTEDLRAAERYLTTLELARIKGDADTQIAAINAETEKARNVQEQLRKDNISLQTNLEKERTARLQLEGKTDGFRLDIAKANAQAAEANKIAEGERLARVKIEEKLAHRSISMAQIVKLSLRLKPYAGTPVDMLQIGESPEIANFHTLVVAPLRDALWLPVSSTAVGSGAFIGLAVAVLPDATDSEKLAATALLSAFNAEGIMAIDGGTVKREDWPGFVMAPTGVTPNKAPIRIYIGSKP